MHHSDPSGALLANHSLATRLQMVVPGHMWGRVMGMYVLLFVGTTPVGSVLVGTLAERTGVSAWSW